MTDFATLSLFVATPEQTQETRKRTHGSWSRGLSVEAYVKRDNVMDNDEHAADGKLVTWVLAPRSDPTTLDFKCSCESYRRTGLTALPDSAGVSPVICYGVASVFTPPKHRGHGYASHMMSLLHWVLAPSSSLSSEFPPAWGAPPSPHFQDAQFSVLYSDVGSIFYAKCGPVPSSLDSRIGWITKSPVSTQWDIVPARSSVSDTGAYKWLSRTECIDVWKLDTELLKSDAVTLAQKHGKSVFAFLPDNGVGQFSIQRLMTFDEDLEPVYPPEPWGVQLLGQKDLTFATWTFEPGTKVMVLTRLRTTPEVLPRLLETVGYKARELGFDTVETWNLPEGLQDSAKELGAKSFERNEHLSAVKWYGKESDGEVEWIFNEKFCWC